MSFINTSISMELGKEYIFTLQSGLSKRIIIVGTRRTENDDMLEVNVDGEIGEYSMLQDALVERYIKIEKA